MIFHTDRKGRDRTLLKEDPMFLYSKRPEPGTDNIVIRGLVVIRSDALQVIQEAKRNSPWFSEILRWR